MEYCLLFGSIVAILMGFAISFDHRNPILCMTMKIHFICKENSFLHRLFPRKESKMYPHSLFQIIPLLLAIIIFPIVLLIYVLFWFTNLKFVEWFILSKFEFIIGLILIVLYFIYPIFLIIFNKLIELKEEKMNKDQYDLMLKKYEQYYKQIEDKKKSN